MRARRVPRGHPEVSGFRKGTGQDRPLNLLRTLREIEKKMGSQKPFAKGPRLIDLDVLLYDDETIDTPELQVPHPRLAERRFVLVPLAELAPALRHPTLGRSISELLAATQDRSEVRLWREPVHRPKETAQR